MTHEQYKDAAIFAKKITQYETDNNEGIVMLVVSEKEDSFIQASNGDDSIIVPLLRDYLMRIIKESGPEYQRWYLQTIINEIEKFFKNK